MIQLDVLTAEEQEKCRKITETDKTIRESLAFPVLFFCPFPFLSLSLPFPFPFPFPNWTPSPA